MTETNPHFAEARATLDLWGREPSRAPQVSGLFECHIFCTPLDPNPEEKERFVTACQEAGIKALCLGLDYEGKGVVNVLQSTKYYESQDARTPIAYMLRDAEALARHFEVVRLKLEAMAENPGIPLSDAQAKEIPGDSYFEYHIKVDAPVSPENDEALKHLARKLTETLGIKIPFSCNNMRGKNQRFLNARTYGMGLEASSAVVEKICAAIREQGFPVGKVIREFIVFDTNKALDQGWLEFS